MSYTERRKYPRVYEAVPCQISAGSTTFVAETRNISCGGALCQFSQSIPLMTKLGITFTLPPLASERAPRPVRCVGVVVRQEPQADSTGASSYVTAIYFLDLKPEDRRHIAEFVLQSMLAHDRRRS